ncbi:biotin--[acetyl-CoA-carboxylase] ligase [Microbacterium paraoxydans]|uniref:biotin--[acetyl-CoA-carboxylase] ligase n=1 Tax=Microbacterium paraoxydans TaxID=199592 RepID=UPI001CFAFED3|nr:biotin--[acetyl-CoA-carboxylase] ligase [Microbacterium paraoxydans]
MSISFPRSSAIAPRLELVARTGSTNADLREHADDADEWPHLSILATRNQTAGRGRLDRTWVAPDGAALAVSVLLRALPAEPTSRGWIPLIAGLAMAEAVAAQLPDEEVAVKWPNDVLVDGRKICGILAEGAGDAIIVGAGVNTAMAVAQLPVPTATSFAAHGVDVDEDRLLATYVTVLDTQLRGLFVAGDAIASGVHKAVSERCATLGRTIRVSMPGDRTVEGTAVGLDPQGRLQVVSGGIEHSIAAGDVIHVRPAGN